VPTLKVNEIVEATGGRLLRGDAEAALTSYTIDTRSLRPGGAFFALAGTRVDGHAFVSDAARAGAAMAVVERAPEGEGPFPPALLQVESTVAALDASGRLARSKHRGPVVAVTGSAGKTTTKELIAAGLGARRRVHKTPGNLNNQLGVPLSLLASPDDAEVQVLEMGMSGFGEIAALTKLCDPDVGLVTNVRPVHLEFFRTLDDIAAAKGEMYAMLRKDSTAVVNLEDPNVRLQAARHAGPRVTFGKHASADVTLQAVGGGYGDGTSLTIRHAGVSRRIDLRIGGAHAAWNAVAAFAAIVAVGEPDLDAAAAAMGELAPEQGRGRVHHLSGDVLLVDDTYNSNPAAMASVLDTMRATPVKGRKVLVMGDMLELGPDEASFHRSAGERAAHAGVDLLLGVGARSKAAVEGARRAGLRNVHHHDDADAAAAALLELVQDGDLVVVKGSRGVHLERVVSALVRAREERA
jgi:UDP-N-acetylmuramoyl-tripeptide--D-alanyl-D-alanine ligase